MKTALVTGASRGIGRGIAEALSGAGYTVVGNCLHHAELLSGSGIVPHAGDVSDPSYLRELVAFAREKLSHIDVVFHNAGVCSSGLLQDFSPEEWHRIMSTNLDSAFYLTKEIIPVMLSQGYGKIIFTSSVWGQSGAACSAAYSASKGAVNAFTRSVSKELAASNIQVNAIAPGAFDTDMNRCYSPEELSALCDEIPAGRLGDPAEIGKLALFLAEAPAYLTGQIITMDGGWM